MDPPNLCPKCKFTILPDWFFCPNCGTKLKEKPLVISIPKQILIYLVSFFLAPFGLGWGMKYLFNQDLKVRMVGIISIVLTAASIILMLVIFKKFMDQYSYMLNNLQNLKSY